MAARGKNRQFPTAFKLKAIKRVERDDGVLPVARELGISRKILHDWIKEWKAHGPEGLNRRPGPNPIPESLSPRRHMRTSAARSHRRRPASPSSNGWWAASRWTSSFFGKPCAHWSSRWRKANPYRHHRSRQSHDSGDNRFPCQRPTPVPPRGAAARDLL
ncbi:helix-turn-helix domain-containing protein [Bradyrhizobium sp. SSUT77]|uniref:helix-turn-helix domain-containing protein n=1 Tax=Bradyrhizobium sp. SSUT77 TaxID=3040603 RepID=UPI00244ACEA5|nr:helix-turn-helix domain-containing protein [Bradyrhizobium sp. SSUT77]MDH2348162.1 helix-turn-helix domain-containing protein [Bradyrhizobium sp. SSUT77]